MSRLLNWIKSSYSNGNGGNNCVQVAFSDNGQVHIRDSKLGSDSPHLLFSAPEWDAFVAGAKASEFDRPND